MQQVSSERDAALAEVARCQVGSSTSHHVTARRCLEAAWNCAAPEAPHIAKAAHQQLILERCLLHV